MCVFGKLCIFCLLLVKNLHANTKFILKSLNVPKASMNRRSELAGIKFYIAVRYKTTRKDDYTHESYHETLKDTETWKEYATHAGMHT